MSPKGIRRMADDLEDMSDRLDRLGGEMPTQVYAGVFEPHVTDMVNAAAANIADLILRLRETARMMRESADYYEKTEQANVEDVAEIFRVIKQPSDDPSMGSGEGPR